ncbi:hypothetical protein A2697_01620 [Candidatus Curtissbacteria bacterium RIFCSPHIGHO2_01_FULL_41_44]|uniref:Glycosyl transferase family 1 domain-containing protein n=1 Tax=Candidatus Curtissbacteria bacterium RIFCSPLOWO2_01_FULL_42_50 TaxID=1797730 RepID=A0A1F5H6E3_9BACT|nr:MAG: hypothetical protein A2697_01620 [Candidatus Curtissbacteria bacterium RIFCSPHIGHO2_01_FULL_41_44]OGD99629.1 MAG: hypothetical protein A3B54_02995 [Candidatus Curtissbacteria bacterium RIFCSPLOWO2_01_FULL_42_50]
MKILMVTEFFPTGKDLRFSGGVEARTYFVAKHLAKKHQVCVITSRDLTSPKVEKMFGFTVYRTGPRRSYIATAGDLLKRIYFIKDAISFGTTLDIEIVDGANFITHFIAKMIARNKKIPIISWYPDVWVNSWIKNVGIYGIFGEILERLNLFLGFNSYIAISKETAKKLKKHIKGKINVIPCGVDQKEFTTPAKKFETPTIICISRLAKYKNLRTLILAFAHLTTKLASVRLIIVGSGPNYNNLKNLTKGLKIDSKVKFLSNISRKELVRLVKSSHIFSLPSLVEGFGIATIEACCAGLPYVNSDIPTHREVTNNAKGGFLVDPQEPRLFSKRFYELFNDGALYKKKSLEAKKLAQNYDWRTITQKTEKIYIDLYTKNTQLRKNGIASKVPNRNKGHFRSGL